jgi:hypothetical protein
MSESRDVSELIELKIEGLSEPAIARYFETLNTGKFQATAALFANDGVMYPPFDDALVGREAIAAYLETEAKGMTLLPRQGIPQTLETGDIQYEITGKVQTPYFGVNVAWHFVLNPQSEIRSVRIKLLAALKELLEKRSFSLQPSALSPQPPSSNGT